MGCLYSTDEVPEEETPFTRTYKLYVTEFKALRLKESDVEQLYNIFVSLDDKNTGWVDLKNFYRYTKLQPTAFCEYIFNYYNDPNQKGFISFRDFVITLWNFCTLSAPTLVDYVFSVYDADNSKDIDMDEAKSLIIDMYGENFLKSAEAKRVLDELGSMRDVQSIKIEIFHHFVKMNPTLLKPAFELQKHLRDAIVNDEFWMIYSKRRVEVYGVKTLLHVDEVLATIPRKNIPATPDQVRLMNKPTPVKEARVMTPPEKGTKEWKKQMMSKRNKSQQGLDGIDVPNSPGSTSSANSPVAAGTGGRKSITRTTSNSSMGSGRLQRGNSIKIAASS